MGITYSKFLCEYKVVANVNDRFEVDDSPSTGPYVVTLTAGRYRDVRALAAEIETQLATAGSTAVITVAVSNTTGLITFTGSAAWSMDWDTTSYGTTLRNDLGFSGSESMSGNALTAAAMPVGCFYPSEPVESDDRPAETGSDRWDSDTQQQEGRTGVIATKGGTVAYSRRSITLLLSQDDLDDFETWLQRVRQGYSFAFYHDRTVAWDGDNNEYEQYKLQGEGESGMSYDPERVDPSNTLWHRSTLQLRKYVAPTT